MRYNNFQVVLWCSLFLFVQLKRITFDRLVYSKRKITPESKHKSNQKLLELHVALQILVYLFLLWLSGS